MGEQSCDVLVIGAGAAGLAAAAELAKAGRSAFVLEARDRIGGRVWTHTEPGFPVPIELGAEFIHGEAAATFALLREASTCAMDVPEAHWSLQNGKLVPLRDAVFKDIQKSIQRAQLDKKPDMPLSRFLSRSARYGLSAQGRKFARMLVEGFDAADPALVSAQSIAEEWRSGAAADSPQFRPLGGYAALLNALAQQTAGSAVRVQLQTVVESVRWRRGAVEVAGRFMGQAFRASAERAIVTLPLGVLQRRAGSPGAVRFDPPLKRKRQAFVCLAAGPVLKVVMRFRAAFWEEVDRCRYRAVTFFHAPELEFPTFWTALPLRAPMLVAWCGGPRAAQLANTGENEIVRRAAASLQALFGKRCNVAGLLDAAWCHNWQADPFARGAYSYVKVAGRNARETLAKPLVATLFFAGEAADTEGEAGTIAGALQSGRRVAREALTATN